MAMAVTLPAISVTPTSFVASAGKRRPTAVKLQRFTFHSGVDVDEHRKNWENFYERHQNKFFKDRHYLEKDWGQYFCDDNTTTPLDRKTVLEAGCGAGNTLFPLAKKYPQLYIHACDFSHHAVTLVKVFTLSAVSPEKMPIVIQNLGHVLKPNGHVLFRDYSIGDYAQVMLMHKNQVISENFYFRGDGTCSFYFSEDMLTKLFERAGFIVVDVNTYHREIINRARNITMQRRWIRAVFRRT